jgi:hypothetical protein
MKVGVMQPYFFPYLGYFQLINAVDVYVNLDHVAFMKRSYMTRNMLKNNTPISIPVKNASQNTPCSQTFVDISENYLSKFYKTLEHLYSKSPYYEIILNDIVTPEIQESTKSISELNISLISRICEYLKIETKIIPSSLTFNVGELKREHMIKDIVMQLNADEYINAIGGKDLYDAAFFTKDNIKLKFLKMDTAPSDDSHLSILHKLFVYSPEQINTQLKHVVYL